MHLCLTGGFGWVAQNQTELSVFHSVRKKALELKSDQIELIVKQLT